LSLNTTAESAVKKDIVYNNNLTREKLILRYKEVRIFSIKLCETLNTEDFVIQSMPDASPVKWHLAHTTWFWEAFVLKEVYKNYKSINPQFNYLFNSYYIQVGERFSRPHRGLLSRPTVKEVMEYREYVDENMQRFLETADDKEIAAVAVTIDIGLNHEQQHQELILTDVKHMLSINPLYPVFKKRNEYETNDPGALNWININEGIYEIGYKGKKFFYDNEKPVHKTYVPNFTLASRLTTNKEYIEFIEDGGYSKPEFWLSNGIAAVETEKWKAPLYWEKRDGKWYNFTLSGFREVILSEPVTHISFYEAEAFSQWSGCRLPTESEWEIASQNLLVEGNFVDSGKLHPVPLNPENAGKLGQMFGDVWEWTRSDYAPYPGYKIPPGAIGEYNGKFMSGQIVLRGGSCATSKSHIRNTYRNFFPHNARWQFSGIRLAKNN